jgi:uncharacterized membrane protein
MSPIGLIHTAFAVLALASGAAILVMDKGSPRHRRTGWVYVVSMIAMNSTALVIYRLFGGFGPFHVAALLSLATVIAGLVPVMRRRPVDGWLELHYNFMAYSYVGLAAAAASEVGTRMPQTVFWWAVLVATVAVIAVGVVLVRRFQAGTLAKVRLRPDFRAS